MLLYIFGLQVLVAAEAVVQDTVADQDLEAVVLVAEEQVLAADMDQVKVIANMFKSKVIQKFLPNKFVWIKPHSQNICVPLSILSTTDFTNTDFLGGGGGRGGAPGGPGELIYFF